MGFLDDQVKKEFSDYVNSGTLADVFKFLIVKFAFGEVPEKEAPLMSYLTEQQREGLQQITLIKNQYVNKYMIMPEQRKARENLRNTWHDLLIYPVSVGGRGRADARAALTGEPPEQERQGILGALLNRPKNVEIVRQP